jgi:hypothetical protein
MMKFTIEELFLVLATLSKGITYFLAMIALIKFIFWM